MLFLFLVPTQENAQAAELAAARLEGMLSQMAKGDMAALESLYKATQSAVYGFALSFLKNKHTAEDVLQEAYIIFYTKAASYRPKGKPMAWMMTIVRNLCLMQLRQNPAAPLEEWQPENRAEDFTPNTMDKLVLQAALTILSEEERQIIMLHTLAGMKHREIADFFGKPVGTILSKYRRALSKLQDHLKEEAV